MPIRDDDGKIQSTTYRNGGIFGNRGSSRSEAANSLSHHRALHGITKGVHGCLLFGGVVVVGSRFGQKCQSRFVRRWWSSIFAKSNANTRGRNPKLARFFAFGIFDRKQIRTQQSVKNIPRHVTYEIYMMEDSYVISLFQNSNKSQCSSFVVSACFRASRHSPVSSLQLRDKADDEPTESRQQACNIQQATS